MQSQTKPLAEPHWIHFYLWRHLGRPIYVGQSVNVERRNKWRVVGKEKSSIGKFIASHINECTLETLPDLAFDISQGDAANEIENELMDLYNTLYPNGFNMCKENGKGPLDFASLGGKIGGRRLHELY